MATSSRVTLWWRLWLLKCYRLSLGSGIWEILGQRAAKKLAASRDTRAVNTLLGMLYSQFTNVTCTAAWVLGEIGDTRAVEPLIHALHSDGEVQRAVAEALVKMGAVEPVIDQLGHRGNAQSWWQGAAEVLVEMRAVKPLLARLKNRGVRTPPGIIWALGKIGDARAVEPLVEVLKSQDGEAQWSAAKALVEMRAVEPLLALLKNRGARTLPAVIWALKRIGDARAVEPLVEVLKSREAARSSVVNALQSLGWQPADDEQRVLYAITYDHWDKIASMGAAAVEPLLAELTENPSVEGACHLAKIGHPRGVAMLVALAERTESPDSYGAAYELAKIGHPRGVATLVALLKRSYLGREVFLALGEFGDASAVKPLLSRAATDPCNGEKAIRALEEILKRTAATIAQEDLRAITCLDNVVQAHNYYSCDAVDPIVINEPVDYSSVKMLALQGLYSAGLGRNKKIKVRLQWQRRRIDLWRHS